MANESSQLEGGIHRIGPRCGKLGSGNRVAGSEGVEIGDDLTAGCGDAESLRRGVRELQEKGECHSSSGGCRDICEGCNWKVPCAYPL